MTAIEPLDTAHTSASDAATQIARLLERDFPTLTPDTRRALVMARYHATVAAATLDMLWEQAGAIPSWLSDAPSVATARELLGRAKDHAGLLLDRIREAHHAFVERGKYPQPTQNMLVEKDGSRTPAGQPMKRKGVWLTEPELPSSWFRLIELVEGLPGSLDEADSALEHH
jgi:hypothetical protein